MKDSDYDFKSTILGNAKMENLSLSQLDENTIELHFPVPPSFDISPSNNDAYTKKLKERFSKVQHHVKILAVDIEKDDQ